MAFWTNMLKRSDSRYYTGTSATLQRRISQLQAGLHDFTSQPKPDELVSSQDFSGRIQMRKGGQIVGRLLCAKKGPLIAGNRVRLSFFTEPFESGFSTCREVNANGRRPATPLILSKVEIREGE